MDDISDIDQISNLLGYSTNLSNDSVLTEEQINEMQKPDEEVLSAFIPNNAIILISLSTILSDPEMNEGDILLALQNIENMISDHDESFNLTSINFLTSIIQCTEHATIEIKRQALLVLNSAFDLKNKEEFQQILLQEGFGTVLLRLLEHQDLIVQYRSLTILSSFLQFSEDFNEKYGEISFMKMLNLINLVCNKKILKKVLRILRVVTEPVFCFRYKFVGNLTFSDAFLDILLSYFANVPVDQMDILNNIALIFRNGLKNNFIKNHSLERIEKIEQISSSRIKEVKSNIQSIHTKEFINYCLIIIRETRSIKKLLSDSEQKN
eukprot:TRINITY_DN401_c0_g1_i1.p1 TRINITY_DN401_c0_g1~~TRINITY_DN401_c0_g1_i1.p1  ORF type:complete len:323 (-),score=73.26 TRINITY_DN401_c0_g1_i1:868-1836(-)